MDFTKLTTCLDHLVQAGIPGADMMISVDGETVYRHYTGYRDMQSGIAMDGSELYQTYSAAKLVTVTAALSLYEKGAFRLSDPVSAYIPEFADLRVRHEDGQLLPACGTMTVEHLFTMTSGIRYDLALPAIRKAVAETDGCAPTMEIARAIASAPLAFEPGSHFHYSLSHDVLAAVVEVVAGMPFREYVRQRVFQPCGMVNSGFHLQESDRPRFASQYRFNGEFCVPMSQDNEFIFGTEYDSGGAGLYSTVEDLMRLLRMLTRKGTADTGQQVLLPETVEKLRRNRLDTAQLADFAKLRMDGYGYGLGVRTKLDTAAGLPGDFGWFGAAGVYLLADPERKLSMCYAQQVRGFPVQQLHTTLRELTYEALNL